MSEVKLPIVVKNDSWEGFDIYYDAAQTDANSVKYENEEALLQVLLDRKAKRDSLPVYAVESFGGGWSVVAVNPDGITVARFWFALYGMPLGAYANEEAKAAAEAEKARLEARDRERLGLI